MSEQSAPVPALKVDLIARLTTDLRASNWTVETLDGMLSQGARDAMMRDLRVPALVELEGKDHPAATLTRFFVLGSNEPRELLSQALPTLGASGLVDLGLARPVDSAGCTLTALFDLRPHAATLPNPNDADNPQAERDHHWWIVSDLSEATTGQPLHPDHVLGIGGATISLLGLTMRTHVQRALDVGCGCGIQALYLATHCDHVVATDLSARACALTQFNAALNDVDIDVRQGSLFDPVTGEDFDLIVSNPPFVITPESVRSAGAAGMLEYRDGGMERDNLIREIITQSPTHLAPGGVLQMLANWEIPADCDPDTEWSQRIEEWLDGLGVDAWVVQRDVLDPARYVDMWIRDSGGQLVSRELFEDTFSTWLRDFMRAGVGAIGMGFVALRRPRHSGSDVTTRTVGDPVHLFESELSGKAPRGQDVAHVLGCLHLPETLWDLRLERASDVREERHYVPGDPDPSVLILHQGAGLGRSIRVGSATSAVVGASDGELTVGQITTAVAMLSERDIDEVRREVDPSVRELIRAGMLEIVEDELHHSRP
ncbi:class I SAM-dependent methyltransferase [Schaalia sp. ZJ1691]|uniref:methyltransferase n=1 Tax=Schaalia sp. ZJ1691 TaxID=2709404 RepID=UPI0013ECE4C7|nr:class I SAM-dependent methyltransferase [Schaalia sp. ZJ1691]